MFSNITLNNISKVTSMSLCWFNDFVRHVLHPTDVHAGSLLFFYILSSATWHHKQIVMQENIKRLFINSYIQLCLFCQVLDETSSFWKISRTVGQILRIIPVILICCGETRIHPQLVSFCHDRNFAVSKMWQNIKRTCSMGKSIFGSNSMWQIWKL